MHEFGKITKSLAIACLVVAIGGLVWLMEDAPEAQVKDMKRLDKVSSNVIAEPEGGKKLLGSCKKAETGSAEIVSSNQPEQLVEESSVKEDAEEKLVNEFDALTDKWMEAEKDRVTMNDVASFVKTFKAVPKNRQDECIHRALNLIPDENVMLLAGVLMDKEVDPEIVETVFNDVLNRDENVKQPILKQIYKDRSHKCWADVAWIFDVTGEK